jgi:hypothetical protein
LRQVDRSCGEISCRRATSETTAPGAQDSATICALTSSLQRRRRGRTCNPSTTPQIMLRSALFMTERILLASPSTTRWERNTAYDEETRQSTAASGDLSLAHHSNQFVQSQIGVIGNHYQQAVRVLLQGRHASTAWLRPRAAVITPALKPLYYRARAHRKKRSHLVSRGATETTMTAASIDAQGPASPIASRLAPAHQHRGREVRSRERRRMIADSSARGGAGPEDLRGVLPGLDQLLDGDDEPETFATASETWAAIAAYIEDSKTDLDDARLLAERG